MIGMNTMADPIKVKSEDIRMVPIADVVPSDRNRNRHPEEQIERLAKIIEYQGFRAPLIVSKRSGLLVSGHGRLMAAKKLGLTHVPVMYQDFDSDDQEYAAMVSENSIASWAELDFSGINMDLANLGPDFELDLLGIKNFVLDMNDKINSINGADENAEWVDMPDFEPGKDYVRLVVHFDSEDQRAKFCIDKQIVVQSKASKLWMSKV